MATSDVDINFGDNEIFGVPLPPDSLLYQVRTAEEEKADRVILEPGALVRIRGSHGMGKTSLIDRLLQRAAGADCKTAYLSLTEIDSATLNHLDNFLQEFCFKLGQALQVPDQLDEYWDDFFGSTICCKSYFEEYLLPEVSGSIVLALDNVHGLFAWQDLADDFFALLRAWHEDAKTREVWQQLRLIVAHSTDLYVPQNINKSPFNVGLPVDLPPLSREQVQHLLNHWQVPLPEQDVDALAKFVGGRPDLTQLACWALSQNGGDVAAIMEPEASARGIFAVPVQRVNQALAEHPGLEETLTQIAAGLPLESLNISSVYQLDSLGLITVTEHKARFSCGVYAQWFASR
jgi:hypothetical protein